MTLFIKGGKERPTKIPRRRRSNDPFNTHPDPGSCYFHSDPVVNQTLGWDRGGRGRWRSEGGMRAVLPTEDCNGGEIRIVFFTVSTAD